MHKLITPYALQFGKANVVIQQFSDNESYVFIPKIKTLQSKGKNKKVTIYHSLYPEPDKRIFELLLILSRVVRETKHIEVFVPYLPYSRQDKEHKDGEVVSADILCGLLKAHGVKKLTTYDCHFLPRTGNFVRAGLHIENLSAGKQLLAHAKKYFGKEKFCLISPDEGSSYFIENAQGFALKKKRERVSEDGIHTEVRMLESELDVNGKNVCIMDDMVDTGGTIVKALKHLKDNGAKKIIVGTAHGVFSKADAINKILGNSCDELFMTDSIPVRSDMPHSLVKILKLPK